MGSQQKDGKNMQEPDILEMAKERVAAGDGSDIDNHSFDFAQEVVRLHALMDVTISVPKLADAYAADQLSRGSGLENGKHLDIHIARAFVAGYRALADKLRSNESC